ncbi:MAG: glycosyltransferase family 2 protein [Halioglobus sp.]|nr:glycosyltransferase family 2 protein [Halioglobus sp.]
MPGSHCVVIPFFNRVSQVRTCLESLLAQALTDTEFLLVDDASTEPLDALQSLLGQAAVNLISHPANEGVAAARNSALHWCRQRGHALAIMIDSDCSPGPDFITTHVTLHAAIPDAACIGAAIVGQGSTLWARIDGLASWVHAAPHYPQHDVESPYHLPTTNFSVKMNALPEREFVFDERLITGEDCLLIREYRQHSRRVVFSPQPVIYHRDRDRLRDVIRHHYKWGHHQYFVQLGRDISPHVFNPVYRVLFLLCFLPAWIFYALMGATLNILPWLRTTPRNIVFAPAIYVLWLFKGVAVMEAAVRPRAVMRRPRQRIRYRVFDGVSGAAYEEMAEAPLRGS